MYWGLAATEIVANATESLYIKLPSYGMLLRVVCVKFTDVSDERVNFFLQGGRVKLYMELAHSTQKVCTRPNDPEIVRIIICRFVKAKILSRFCGMTSSNMCSFPVRCRYCPHPDYFVRIHHWTSREHAVVSHGIW
jgi:hypothetical protein